MISEPYITVEEFCRRTGYKEGTVSELTDELMARLRKHKYSLSMNQAERKGLTSLRAVSA